MEAGKKRLEGDQTREATSDEVAELRRENARLKETVADLVLRYDIVKKAWTTNGKAFMRNFTILNLVHAFAKLKREL